MKKLSIALLGASVLASSACGGSNEPATVNNSVEDYNVQADDLGITDNSLGDLSGDTLGNEANALESDLGNTAETNATETNTTEAAGNSQ